MSTLFENIERIKTAKSNIITSLKNIGIDVSDMTTIEEIETIISSIKPKETREKITFYINDDSYGERHECEAENGMTLGEWYYSEYSDNVKHDILGLVVDLDFVSNDDFQYLVDTSGNGWFISYNSHYVPMRELLKKDGEYELFSMEDDWW